MGSSFQLPSHICLALPFHTPAHRLFAWLGCVCPRLSLSPPPPVVLRREMCLLLISPDPEARTAVPCLALPRLLRIAHPPRAGILATSPPRSCWHCLAFAPSLATRRRHEHPCPVAQVISLHRHYRHPEYLDSDCRKCRWQGEIARRNPAAARRKVGTLRGPSVP